MFGLRINDGNRSSLLTSISIAIALVTVCLGIWLGPKAVYVTSFAGLLLAGSGLIFAFKVPILVKPTGFPFVGIGIHLILLGTAAVLQLLFLTPLSPDVQKIPRLQFEYKDSESGFGLRGPLGWSYENLALEFGTGVRIRPVEQKHYMGVSEITVLIRKLESKPTSTQKFLENMAQTSAEEKGKRSKLFQFEVSSADLLDRRKGTWSILSIRRFWVPVRQVSLFGIKNECYLCSVSVIGLEAHSALSKVLCLGLFETIIVLPAKLK